jgi:hypothetical protein
MRGGNFAASDEPHPERGIHRQDLRRRLGMAPVVADLVTFLQRDFTAV